MRSRVGEAGENLLSDRNSGIFCVAPCRAVNTESRRATWRLESCTTTTTGTRMGKRFSASARAGSKTPCVPSPVVASLPVDGTATGAATALTLNSVRVRRAEPVGASRDRFASDPVSGLLGCVGLLVGV